MLYQGVSHMTSPRLYTDFVMPAARDPCTTAPQEVFLTQHHLGIAMEYAPGGDLAQFVQQNRLPGVRASPPYCTVLLQPQSSACLWTL